MKNYKKIALMTLAGLLFLSACGTTTNKSKTSTSETSKTSQSSETTSSEPQSVEFFADGEYEVGTDIQPGSYYAVLTEFESDKDYAYINFKYGTDFDNQDNYEYEELKKVGKIYKVTLKKGMKLRFNDPYDGVSSWNMTLFTAEDYKEYQKSEQKESKTNSSESSSSSSSSESSTESSTSSESSSSSTASDSSSTEVSASSSGTIYSDSYIEVSKNKGLLSIKNLSGQDILLDGQATFNQTKEINMYSFGYIGDVKTGGTKTENISTVTLMNEGEPGDTEDGETLGGDKTFKHKMKAGETITWSGEIKDKDYNTLSQITFDITY
ncbi:hypothetical protein [Streptococcus cuniculipharyngis]|uniref:DUF4352 domain-containing protein n=1 Tax=Streptococcus cuniculipharyngis TaxID=1562651 RepID=A0A5C5SEP1_9STRE|nr:hypothetical protein [Streptococcus cuniculipharyngis]TWS98760.1 hypothetical protein FRX57_00600 [Streptococcus cuniculipharyngis]